MLLTKRLGLVFGLIYTICVGSVAQAVDCGAKSDLLVSLGEEVYYELDAPIKLSSKESKALEELYEEMQGRWKGSLVEAYCRGSEEKGSDKKIKRTATVAPEIEVEVSDKPTITDEIEFDDESIKVYTRQPVGAESIHRFSMSGSKKIAFTEIYRRLGVNYGTYLVEEHYKISMKKKRQVRLEIVRFINGYFSSEETWDLKRR